jgi:hypothetical protein
LVSASNDPFKVIGLAPKHRFGLRVFAKQTAIDRWRQSSQRTAVSSKLRCVRLVGTIACALLLTASENSFNATQKTAGHRACAKTKKEQGRKPCSKNCVDPISPKIWI